MGRTSFCVSVSGDGQAAVRLRCAGGGCAACSAPFPLVKQQEALYLAKGDMTAGETKTVIEPTTITARLQLLVPDGEAEDLLSASAADSIELGPFKVLQPPSCAHTAR